MIEFQQVSKQLGTRVILQDTGFYVQSGSRVGVVGPNGAGKTTLFRMVTGEESCDGGDINLPRNTRLGYLRQQLDAKASSATLVDHAAGGIPELAEIEHSLHKIEHRIPSLSGSEREQAIRKTGDLQHRFEDLGGYEIQSRAEAALHGLGFRESDFNRPLSSFSGGWQMRAELVRTLAALPDTLLLDEPSNYLDLPAVEWLQGFLNEYPGTLLMISHDRYLLRTLTDTTLEVAGGDARLYSGGYDEYVRQRDEERRVLEAAKANQDRQREKTEQFIERFRAKATKASQVQSRIKQLEKMEEIVVPGEAFSFSNLALPAPPSSGSEMMRLDQAGIRYGDSDWVFRHLDLSIRRSEKTAVVGFNGMGKTTLLRMLAGVLPLSEGRRVPGHHVVVGYQSQEFGDTLPAEQTVYRIVADAAGEDHSERTVRTALGRFGFSGDDVWKVCRVLSGGEKIRLAFARIFVRPPNLLLLDEPTTHLDIQGCAALEEALVQYPGTVVLVSHDVTFVRRVAEEILAVTPSGLRRYHGGYDYYLEKAQTPAASPTPSRQDSTSGPDEKKRTRVQRAENREKLRGVRKQVSKTERVIEKLEAEQKELTETLYTESSSSDKAAANRRLYEISIELDRANTAWDESVSELTTLEAEFQPEASS